MTDRAFTLAMVYAGWSEPNIRCELFLRQLRGKPRRIEGMDGLRDLLWALLALAVLAAFWIAVGIGIYRLTH